MTTVQYCTVRYSCIPSVPYPPPPRTDTWFVVSFQTTGPERIYHLILNLHHFSVDIMGKKRHALLDESDLDSSSDGSSDHERFEDRDLEAEHELFNDPYQSKRSKKRRTNGKAEALYGVFAEDHTEDIRKPQKINKRLHK